MSSQETRTAIVERLELECIRWEDLLAQIPAERMVEPETFGDWSFKDVVAHLAGWDRP